MNASAGPFLVILASLGLGLLLRRSRHLPDTAPKTLNAYVIAVAVPALVLAQLPGFLRELGSHVERIDAGLVFLPLIPWLIFFGAIGFFGWLHRKGVIRRDQWALLSLSAGLGNTAFVGFPLIEALVGPRSLPLAILLDQLGTFLALSVAGTFFISYVHATEPAAGDAPEAAPKFHVDRFARELFRFPPFLALLASFGVAAIGTFPPIAQGVIEKLAATLVPVAMVSVGAQLRFDRRSVGREARGLFVGLGYKMALAPLGIALLAYGVFRLRDEKLAVAVLEAAMAPMITSTVLGIEADFAPELGALMLGVGIPLSLLTVPLVHLFFSR
ncbi:MAG: AEC family transporter [Bdellovibrionales bacterium]|nr:AEC family transporter [Bdellovibrionales bacterium]